MKHVIFLSSLCLAYICLSSSYTYACSPNTGNAVGGDFFYIQHIETEELPENFRFIVSSYFESSPEWELETENQTFEKVNFELESDFSYGTDNLKRNVNIWRPIGLKIGDRLRTKHCNSNCVVLTIVSSDDVAPAKQKLSLPEFKPYPDPNDDCRFGSLGSLKLRMSPGEEEGALLSPMVFVYIGDTPEEAQQAETPFSVSTGYNEPDTLWVGLNEALTDVAPLSGFCLAVELMDGAANRSPRSESFCWDGIPPNQEVPSDMGGQMEPEPDMGTQLDMSQMEPTGDMMLNDGANASNDDKSESTCATTWTHKKPTPAWLLFLLLGFIRSRHKHPRCRTTR